MGPLFLVCGQQRADVFHGALEAAFDLGRNLAQLVVLSFQLAEALGEFIRARLLGAQTVLDHRLQPAQRVVDAIFGTCCLGH